MITKQELVDGIRFAGQRAAAAAYWRGLVDGWRLSGRRDDAEQTQL